MELNIHAKGSPPFKICSNAIFGMEAQKHAIKLNGTSDWQREGGKEESVRSFVEEEIYSTCIFES